MRQSLLIEPHHIQNLDAIPQERRRNDMNIFDRTCMYSFLIKYD